MADQGNGTERLGGVFRHLLLPEQSISDESTGLFFLDHFGHDLAGELGPQTHDQTAGSATSAKPTINWIAGAEIQGRASAQTTQVRRPETAGLASRFSSQS
jgi:hypothetical protein